MLLIHYLADLDRTHDLRYNIQTSRSNFDRDNEEGATRSHSNENFATTECSSSLWIPCAEYPRNTEATRKFCCILIPSITSSGRETQTLPHVPCQVQSDLVAPAEWLGRRRREIIVSQMSLGGEHEEWAGTEWCS